MLNLFQHPIIKVYAMNNWNNNLSVFIGLSNPERHAELVSAPHHKSLRYE